jgi:transcriptional regulator with XRE-family HTH domain
MTLSEMKKKWQKDSAFQAEYDALKPEFAFARRMIAARGRSGLSQAAVARRMKTTQSTVARLESGKAVPSLNSLMRYAHAIGHRVDVRLIQSSRG